MGALPWLTLSCPVSRQSRLETLVFPRKTRGFAAEGVVFELGGNGWKLEDDEGRRNQRAAPSKSCLIYDYPISLGI